MQYGRLGGGAVIDRKKVRTQPGEIANHFSGIRFNLQGNQSQHNMHRSSIIWAVIMVVLMGGCGGSVPAPGSDSYREAVSAFYSGVAAMEVGEDRRAQAKLTYVTELAPEEPAAWVNLALMALRRSEVDAAAAHLAEARRLDNRNAYALYLSGILELRAGNTEASKAYLRDAVASDSTHLRAVYALWEQVREEAGEGTQVLRVLARQAPENIPVLLAQLEQGMEQEGEVSSALQEALAQRTALFDTASTNALDAVFRAAAAGEMDDALIQLRFLRNILLSEPVYRMHLAALRTSVELIADPLLELQRLETPVPMPAPMDDALTFTTEPFLSEESAPQQWISAVALGNDALPAVFFADGTTLATTRGEQWPLPGAPGPHAVAGVDYNFDFRTDLAMAGPEGFRILAQDSTEAFSDVTSSLGVEASVVNGAYTGIWAADLDLEGDVDLILAGESIQVLRNNGDGTFESSAIFANLPAPANFVWADLDRDGDPDAAWVDHEGQLHLFANERQARFAPWGATEAVDGVVDLAVTDSNNDGVTDLLVLRADGSVVRMTSGPEGWDVETLATADPGFERLLVADLDNNGGQDLVLTNAQSSRVWLQDQDYRFYGLEAAAGVAAFSVASVWQAGRLDLVGLDAEGQPVRAAVVSPRGYHWKEVRPRAAQAVGDQRINSFGIGGEVELRAGILYQKQPITQPIMHFGLGDHLLADIARITWPNGSVQAEFDLQSDQVISAQQRLIGSCPWLYTHNGQEVQFVTDFIWRSPLGLAINAQQSANVMTTEDWVKIRGDQLRPVDGHYDVRITGELWETHFFDHVSLMVVDHPEGTEILLDERFAFPPPVFTVHVAETPLPVPLVITDTGEDVTERIRELDEQYLDFFGRGDYQGITRDHFIEVDLGHAAPDAAWLVARGWIRPTDSSINVAISHGTQAPPKPLRLEVQAPDGTWFTAYENLGFPSGKAKTILIDLEGLFAPGASRRVRLHTNLEIYWDQLQIARKMPASTATTVRLMPSSAQLRYRGFSLVTEANKSSPELPDYNTLAGTAPIWRDLVGYHTRFGDVGELLDIVDDRYVIMNAGDELGLLFPEQPPVADGWTRDYVLIGDGWVKDGNYNTTAGKYVRPLPSHDQPVYDAAPGALQDDPVFQRHAADWQTYHTRYVYPDRFSRGISLR